MASNTVWGLDIGNSAVKAVKMVKVGDMCKIVDFDIIDIPNADDEKERPGRVRAAVSNLVTNHRFGNDPVFIAVNGNVCLHREFQLPPGSEEKLKDLVQYEAKQQIPFPLDQVEWGYERYEDPNGVGVALIAVRKNDIQELLAVAAENKLNIKGITAAPVALFNFIHYEFRPENTTLILDSGSKGTDFVVMNKRQVYFRTIQIAGREITRVLENKFKVPFEKAEELKKKVSESKQADKILNVIEPTLRQLGAEVQRTIGFYKSKARGQRIQQCYLLGHTFRLPKMAESLQTQVREAPFVLVEGLQRVKLDHSVTTDVWENEFPTMAVAVGLGIQGLGLSELTLNLIPETEKTKDDILRWKIWATAAAAVLLVTLGFSYAQAGKAVTKYEERKTTAAVTEELMTKLDTGEKGATVGLTELKDAASRLARVGHDRAKILQAFTRITTLKTSDGKPFFGPENKMYLTNLYISRIPLGVTNGALKETGDRNQVDKSEILLGASSLYAKLSKVGEMQNVPPELRPDVPMIVVVSGEVEGSSNDSSVLPKLTELGDALKKLPEAKDIGTPKYNDGPPRVEAIFEYDAKGNLKSSADKVAGAAAVEAPVKKVATTSFHISLRWVDLTDPDLEPAAPVEAKAPDAKAAPAVAPK